MKVGEICNREVVIVDRQSTVRDAAKLMREFNVGDLVVVEEREGRRVPIGILTDRDIVVKIIAEDVDMDVLQVDEVMGAELFTAGEEGDILGTMKRMRSEGVRRMPVVNADGGLEGIITLDDLLPLVAEQISDLVELISCEQKRERLRTGGEKN
jgi:CBS domain-containing protein